MDPYRARADGGRRRLGSARHAPAAGPLLAASLLLLGLGLVTPVLAWAGWGAAERALRRGEPLPSSPVAPVLAVGTAVVGVLVLLGLVLR